MSKVGAHDRGDASEKTTELIPAEQHDEIRKEIHFSFEAQVEYALSDSYAQEWTAFYQREEMQLFKRKEEIDGISMEPIKALHTIEGVSAREVAHYFHTPEYKMEYETTAEKFDVVYKIDDNNLIIHMLHNNIVGSKRESLYSSLMKQKLEDFQSLCKEKKPFDCWVVTNKSLEIPQFKKHNEEHIRVYVDVCLVAQTFVKDDDEQLDDYHEADRSKVYTKLSYCSTIHPGGWIPNFLLRRFYQSEYPKFLRTFSNYLTEKVKNSDINSFDEQKKGRLLTNW